jgi:hypothetical protein
MAETVRPARHRSAASGAFHAGAVQKVRTGVGSIARCCTLDEVACGPSLPPPDAVKGRRIPGRPPLCRRSCSKASSRLHQTAARFGGRPYHGQGVMMANIAARLRPRLPDCGVPPVGSASDSLVFVGNRRTRLPIFSRTRDICRPPRRNGRAGSTAVVMPAVVRRGRDAHVDRD